MESMGEKAGDLDGMHTASIGSGCSKGMWFIHKYLASHYSQSLITHTVHKSHKCVM